MGDAPRTIGIFFPGELGSVLGRVLSGQGHRVVTAFEGRGPRTCRLGREAGLEPLESFGEVVRAADVVLSVVPPAAAVAAARRYAAEAAGGGLGGRARVFVDFNSVSPRTAESIGRVVSRAGVRFADAAVHGLAATLSEWGAIYLSGPAAGEVAALFGPTPRVRVLGDRPGEASAFKMLISGMSKGLVALFLELGLAAREAGLLDGMLDCYRESYPGVMAVVDRMLPTYPRHAPRRCQELREVERTLRRLGQAPRMIRGARQLTEVIARLGLADDGSPAPDSRAVVEALAARLRPA